MLAEVRITRRAATVQSLGCQGGCHWRVVFFSFCTLPYLIAHQIPILKRFSKADGIHYSKIQISEVSFVCRHRMLNSGQFAELADFGLHLHIPLLLCCFAIDKFKDWKGRAEGREPIIRLVAIRSKRRIRIQLKIRIQFKCSKSVYNSNVKYRRGNKSLYQKPWSYVQQSSP